MFIRDQVISIDPIVAMATQLSKDEQEKIVSLLINIILYVFVDLGIFYIQSITLCFEITVKVSSLLFHHLLSVLHTIDIH